jgi:hypothetical protein
VKPAHSAGEVFISATTTQGTCTRTVTSRPTKGGTFICQVGAVACQPSR